MTTQSRTVGPDAEFWQHLNAGTFMIQRSRTSGEHVFYPRMRAPGSGADDLEWVEASGDGEVYAVTIIPRKPERGGTYNIAIVELAEGPRMMTRIV
ncbi:MAG: OB-fold domain-containing protein, partial [Pseudomonadota bacterium]|nr:OB-fold domain-containing protein [Pseudomonadota bacterium]